MAAIFTLTVRQLAGSRRLWLVLGSSRCPCSPPCSSTRRQHGDERQVRRRHHVDAHRLGDPAARRCCCFGTSAFGNEVGDRTLVYLALKPLPRWRIVAPKLLAALVVGGVPVAISGARRGGRDQGGDSGGALATGVGLLVGAAAYAAVFTWAGLATRHALVIGLVYVFVWEAALAAYLDGIRFLSVRRYTLALDRRRSTASGCARLDLSLGAGAGLAGAAIVIVGFSALAVRKLGRMDVP